MNDQNVIEWLLQGDISIQYQVHRDLLDTDMAEIQNRISEEGWGKAFLSRRKSDGHWGKSFYQPKWISTHYTLLDLRNLNLAPDHSLIQSSIERILDTSGTNDGGIRLGPSTSQRSDVCVNGMFLNYASYFKTAENRLRSVVDALLHEIMPDGGFNCRSTRSGATHSSLHSTISVLEGLFEFTKAGYKYRNDDIIKALKNAEEFILLHRLFLSDRTGTIIHKDFMRLSYPCRWKYNILRALDYFQYTGKKWDDRMSKAVDVIMKKSKNGLWKMPAAHPGKVHFVMEKTGQISRWNTLRAMRVLKHFKTSDNT